MPNIKFHKCLIDTLPNSPRSPANFVSNSNSHEFIDFAVRNRKVEQRILRHFCGFSNNFLRKHARHLFFSLQVLSMMRTTKYYGCFWKVEIIQNGGLFRPIFQKKTLAPTPYRLNGLFFYLKTADSMRYTAVTVTNIYLKYIFEKPLNYYYIYYKLPTSFAQERIAQLVSAYDCHSQRVFVGSTPTADLKIF